MISETNFDHSKVVFSSPYVRKSVFPQNPLTAQFWNFGFLASGDWAGAQWLHQHSESHFFGDTLCTDSFDTYNSAAQDPADVDDQPCRPDQPPLRAHDDDQPLPVQHPRFLIKPIPHPLSYQPWTLYFRMIPNDSINFVLFISTLSPQQQYGHEIAKDP